MNRPWVEGEPHPTNPVLVKGEVPGCWVNKEPQQPLTTDEQREKVAGGVAEAMGGLDSNAVRSWTRRLYGKKS